MEPPYGQSMAVFPIRFHSHQTTLAKRAPTLRFISTTLRSMNRRKNHLKKRTILGLKAIKQMRGLKPLTAPKFSTKFPWISRNTKCRMQALLIRKLLAFTQAELKKSSSMLTRRPGFCSIVIHIFESKYRELSSYKITRSTDRQLGYNSF